MNKVELKFKDKIAIDRGKYFLFIKKDALDFVQECKKEGISILGIDSFYKINEETIQPSMENSVDFSSAYYVQKTGDIYSDAIIFLQDKGENLFFEIVCKD